MSNKILLKRGSTPPPSGTLSTGEMGFDTSANTLYIGDSNGDSKLVGAPLPLSIANGGTGNTTGLAASATKLATAQALRTNLSKVTAAYFDGTTNASIGVSGILPIDYGGTGATTASDACMNLIANQNITPATVVLDGGAFYSTADGTGVLELSDGTESYQLKPDSINKANNAVSIVKLWENASPTSSFTAQTIALDLSGYDFVDIVYYGRTGASPAMATSGFYTARLLFGKYGALTVSTLIGSGADYIEVESRVVLVTETGVKFDKGMYIYANADGDNSSSNDPSSSIPYRIYGIKGVK